MAEYQDYPRMIYHIVEEPRIVQDAEEEKHYIDRGWSRTPVMFTEIRAIEAKIAWHRAEALRLAERLDELKNGLAPEKEVESPETPCGESTEAVPEVPVVKKGRKKKV